jgi:Fe2+ or Zn2+ uptake regulation protein
MSNEKIYCQVCQDEDDTCQECCPHDEHDHGICLDCGKDNYENLVEAVDFND